MQVWSIGGSLLVGGLVLACASVGSPVGADPSDAAAPSFGSGSASGFPEDASLHVQARYVLAGCAGGPESSCHGRGTEGLVLPDTTPTNLVSVASTEEPAVVRVQPGDPSHSYLYWKVTGDPRIQGVPMPMGSSLDARSIGVLADWIDAGAP